MGRDLSDKWFTLDYDLITKALDANEDIYDWLAGGGGMTIKAYNSRWGLTSPFRPGTIVNKNDEDNPYDIQYSYGPGLIAALKQLSDAANLAHSGPDYIRLETRGIGLIMENGKVTGVKAMGPDGKALTFYARKGVVLATGSYAGNDAMVRQYQNMYTQEQLAQLPVKTDNPPTNVGDGIIMAQKLGAQLRDMEFVSGNANNGWHLTYGGLVINPYAQVLDTNNVAIPGLYACGDVTSGFEGYNHQTGTCLTGVIYYGRLAGKELAVSKNIDKL
jgi:fumarate reductase flavoprotein subunit